jgi:hypothetical protein
LVSGEVGCTFTLFVEDVDSQFPDDALEDDDGPLAPLSHLVEDDGSLIAFESESHTERDSDQYWIRFRTLPDTSYHISPIIVDALVDPLLQNGCQLAVEVYLVGPNGGSQEASQTFVYTCTLNRVLKKQPS